MQDSDSVVRQHGITKSIKSFAPCVPASRNDHAQIAGIQFQSSCDKLVVNWFCAGGIPPIFQLIWRIADDDIEVHVENLLRLECVDEFVGVAFQGGVSVIALFGHSTVFASPVLP